MDHERRLAGHGAVGVIGVQNELGVKPRQPITDAALADRIRSSIASNPTLTTASIDARVANGKVTLFGRVPTMFQSAEAADIASSMGGVNAVDNQLEVTAPEAPFVWRHHVFPFGPYVDQWHYVRPARIQSGPQIVRNIRRQMDWNPLVDADQVRVDVHAGNATLTGKVNTWRDRNEAEADAFEGGAVTVEDQLEVGG